MVTPRHFTADLLAAARARLARTWEEAGADAGAMRFAALRHLCVTDSRAEAADFLDNVRHQIRLSQSLRHHREAMQGAMLVETAWEGEMSLEEMDRHMLVGSPERIAERIAEEVRKAEPCHYLLQVQAGASPLGLALRSIERFAGEVRPLLEKALGPLGPIGTRAPVAG
jgi:alkanesulfonate monooxygenase SsuD/methylene tetrahydromethanopterin reductase-like flavin-dependent oxidoreductase (luciferase family)